MAWDTACNFNVILNQTIFNCLITSVSILYMFIFSILIAYSFVYMQIIYHLNDNMECETIEVSFYYMHYRSTQQKF